MDSTSSAPPMEFIDLQAQRRRLGGALDAAIARVLAHGRFILGPEVAAFERALAGFCGARHAIGCASGTDALLLCLMAKGVGPGDAVLVPDFTFAATASMVRLAGATPVLVDVLEDGFAVDPAQLGIGVDTARRHRLTPRGVISVGLFGQPADFGAIAAFCRDHGLWLLDDAAQSLGAQQEGRLVGTLGDMTATSFFPAKPLGCYGDGGAVLTDDDDLAALIRSLALHGAGTHRYDIVRVGINGRLDTLQAAILIEKLAIFAEELTARQAVADRYTALLSGVVATPGLLPGNSSSWAQYTIRLPPGRREGVASALQAEGIPTAIHYPKPLHRQPAFADCPIAGNGAPVADRLASTVLSLPMHPYLADDQVARVADAVTRAVGQTV